MKYMIKIQSFFLAIYAIIIIGCNTRSYPEWIIYNTENSDLPHNRLTCIAIEENETKWIGTRYNGLVKFDGNEWTIYDTTNSELPVNFVRNITIDNYNNKWISTYNDGNNEGGLVSFNRNYWKQYNLNFTIPYITSTAVDIDETIWLLARFEGIIHIDGENLTIYNEDDLGVDIIYYHFINIDTNGIKWIGTQNGLIKFDNNEWTIYNTENSDIPYNIVRNITIDDFGTKWMSCNGLTCYNGINWINYNAENSGLPKNSINPIVIDNRGIKWIGTDDFVDYDYNGGLIKFDGNNWTVYRTENSEIPHNDIYDIAIDKNNTKWICTDNGLAAFNENGIPISNIFD